MRQLASQRGTYILGTVVLLLMQLAPRQTHAAVPDLLWTTATHGHSLTCLTFSPDGSIIASGGDQLDPTVRLWRVRDGETLRTLTGFSYSLSSLAFSPDGATLATGDVGDVKLWRVQDGRLIRTLSPGGQSNITCLAFSHDGSIVAASQADRGLALWWARDGRRLAALAGARPNPSAISFTADDKAIVSHEAGGAIKMWRTSNGQLIRKIRTPKINLDALEFSRDGRKMAIVDKNNGQIRILRLSNGKSVRVFPIRPESYVHEINRIFVAPKGRLVATIDTNGEIRIWKAGRVALVQVYSINAKGDGGDFEPFCFAPNGGLFAYGSVPGRLSVARSPSRLARSTNRRRTSGRRPTP